MRLGPKFYLPLDITFKTIYNKVMTKKNKNILIFISLVIVAIAVGIGLFFLISPNNSKQDETPTSTTKNDSVDNGTETESEESTEINKDNLDYTDGKTPLQYEGQEPGDPPANNNEQFRIPEGE